jgi:hypothetical protein
MSSILVIYITSGNFRNACLHFIVWANWLIITKDIRSLMALTTALGSVFGADCPSLIVEYLTPPCLDIKLWGITPSDCAPKLEFMSRVPMEEGYRITLGCTSVIPQLEWEYDATLCVKKLTWLFQWERDRLAPLPLVRYCLLCGSVGNGLPLASAVVSVDESDVFARPVPLPFHLRSLDGAGHHWNAVSFTPICRECFSLLSASASFNPLIRSTLKADYSRLGW